jgi:beta-glucosidase
VSDAIPASHDATYDDPSAPPEARAEDLLSRLTIDEKFSLCAGKGFWQTKPLPRLGIKPFRLTDGPRGVGFHSSGKRCTAFPSGIAQAATWDEALLQRFGAALGSECRAAGGGTILGPAINIARTPLNGRTFEYFSEDPYLNARLVVPVVRGVQAQGVAACVKHFAANNQETNRVRVSAQVSERALEEIYLPAFRAAVEEGDAWSVMGAYNKVNGVPACENSDLLQRRLRRDWGFRGFVVSDWFATRFTSSTEAAVKGGLSLEMPGKGSKLGVKSLQKAFAEGRFTEAELDNNLRGLLFAMAATGHLDPERRRAARNTPEHQALAREMAEAGMTLLKNDGGLLPLDPSRVKRIAVVGPKLKKRNCLPLWGGSAGVWSPYEITPWKGLQQENRGRFEWVRDAADADVALVFVGLSHKPGLDSEVKDRASLDLPGGQDQLVRDTLARNPNTVVVLINGSPVAMPWVDEVPAILECWYPGMEGGSAIARTLFGDSNPGGKLPVSFPRSLKDSPAHASERSFPGDRVTVHYDEDLFVGYRHFDKFDIEPLFPFGHGLSYTAFEYSNLTLPASDPGAGDTLDITFDLANTGALAGTEVAQVYIEDLQAEDDRPKQALKGFAKCVLQAGQTTTVRVQVPVRSLAIYCTRAAAWKVRAGDYRVNIGASSRDIRLRQNVRLTTDEILQGGVQARAPDNGAADDEMDAPTVTK